PMGMEKLFRATPIYGSDSLFIQLKFLFLKTTIRPFVSEISSCECKRILFHSIPDIDATTGRTANQRAVPKSGENFLQGSAMLFWRLWDGSCFAHNALLDDAKLEVFYRYCTEIRQREEHYSNFSWARLHGCERTVDELHDVQQSISVHEQHS
ncbi:hypothetical protein PV326_013683, partial [Microctonus aethiopoides]